MSRLVLEHLCERDDYRGIDVACKERHAKGDELAESTTQVSFHAQELLCGRANRSPGDNGSNLRSVAVLDGIGRIGEAPGCMKQTMFRQILFV